MLSELFSLNTAPLELFVRGTAIYWALLLTFRFILRRDLGSLTVSDVLFIVIVADAAQNGLSGSYDTVGEALVLVATLHSYIGTRRRPAPPRLDQVPAYQKLALGKLTPSLTLQILAEAKDQVEQARTLLVA